MPSKNKPAFGFSYIVKTFQKHTLSSTLWYQKIVTSRLFFFQKIPSVTPLFDPSSLLILAICLSVRQIIFDYVY